MLRSPWWPILALCVIAASAVRVAVDRIWFSPIPTLPAGLQAELPLDSLEVARHPTSFRTQQRLANVLLRLGHASEAEIPARRAVALAPRQGPAHATLGAILVAEQRLAPGLEELTIALRRGADDQMTYGALAFAQEMSRHDSAAAHTYMEMRNRWPTDPYVLTALTQYLIRKSSPDAFFYAQRVVGMFPNWAVAHVLLAKAYAGRSDAHHAREHMQRATELYPGFMGYWADLGDYALLDGDTAAAWTAFTRARALDSAHFDAMSVYRAMWATVNAAHH